MTTVNTQGFGIQLAPAGFSLEANKIFESYEAALTFVRTKPAAYVGSVITVKAPSTIDGVTYPAGVYNVTAVGENGALEQVGKETDLSNIENDLSNVSNALNNVVSSTQIEKLSTPSTGAAASYRLTMNGAQKGVVIDIPKDMVVSSGVVRQLTPEEITPDRPQGTYIVLTLANATSDRLYIKADSLVDLYTGDGKYIAVNQKTNSIALDISTVKDSILDSEEFNDALSSVVNTINSELINYATKEEMRFDIEFPEVMVAQYNNVCKVHCPKSLIGEVVDLSIGSGASITPDRYVVFTNIPAGTNNITATIKIGNINWKKTYAVTVLDAPKFVYGDGYTELNNVFMKKNASGLIYMESTTTYELELESNVFYIGFKQNLAKLEVSNNGQVIPMVPAESIPEGLQGYIAVFQSPTLKEDLGFAPIIKAWLE